MSAETEETMLQAIKAHYLDEGIPVKRIRAVKVRALINDGEMTRGATYRIFPNNVTLAALECPALPSLPDDYSVKCHNPPRG